MSRDLTGVFSPAVSDEHPLQCEDLSAARVSMSVASSPLRRVARGGNSRGDISERVPVGGWMGGWLGACACD